MVRLGGESHLPFGGAQEHYGGVAPDGCRKAPNLLSQAAIKSFGIS